MSVKAIPTINTSSIMQESKSGVPIKAMPKPSGGKKKAKIVLGSKKTMESANSREKITTERT